MKSTILWTLRFFTFLLLMAVIPLGLRFGYNLWSDFVVWSNGGTQSKIVMNLPITKEEFYGGVSFLIMAIILQRAEFSKELFGIRRKNNDTK